MTDLQYEAHDKWEWVGRIETLSGLKVSIFEPEHDMFNLEDIATSLSHICRYNGHVPHFYSVAEHCVKVAHWIEKHTFDYDIILTGLLHDAAEAYVGDMVRPLKRHEEYGRKHQATENAIAKKIHEKFGGHFPYIDIIHEADKQVYIWEVEHIRTGRTIGLQPKEAKQLWLDAYAHYSLGKK